MRANRPEGFTAHTNITKTQFPYGMSLEEILRAGTAPAPEEKTPKRGQIQIGQRTRQPVRAIAVQPRPKFKPKEPKPSVKFGDLEDDLDERLDLDDRPPCRQNINIFDLEDNFHPKYNVFTKDSNRPCHNDNRPPSRHKTPPKALGLELPPKRVTGEKLSIDHMLNQDSPISSFENESLSNTMPISFDGEKNRKKSIGRDEVPNSKIRIKPKSAKTKENDKANVRMWSATGKTKGKMMDVPIVVSKGDRVVMSFSSSRRDKAKGESEKKEVEEKRHGYFKKTAEKRATSSNKGKINMIVPFQTNLEPEFLNLFARGDDFNF